MENILLALIGKLDGSIFVLICILVVAFILTFKVGAWKQIFLAHTGRIDKVEKLGDLIVEIKTKVDLIYQSSPNALFRSQSPISLTDLGREIAQHIGAESILNKYASKLVTHVEDKNPKNAYDIQKCAFHVARNEMKDLLNEEELNKIKNEAFSRGLPLEEIFSLFGILIRNRVLANKGIPIADVDKHEREEKGIS